ncbi:hypothetical protein CIPAW_11G076900 [Carya illinoinensis]|uniref:Uncharacterized protein n=1 Tax=Carya illinoinensis TaxID=32201 RepID=A0A8T1NZS0_CARIL|nr:hypothetical protein CIPAW_11G076900 [Carya illinoinensis]
MPIPETTITILAQKCSTSSLVSSGGVGKLSQVLEYEEGEIIEIPLHRVEDLVPVDNDINLVDDGSSLLKQILNNKGYRQWEIDVVFQDESEFRVSALDVSLQLGNTSETMSKDSNSLSLFFFK